MNDHPIFFKVISCVPSGLPKLIAELALEAIHLSWDAEAAGAECSITRLAAREVANADPELKNSGQREKRVEQILSQNDEYLDGIVASKEGYKQARVTEIHASYARRVFEIRKIEALQAANVPQDEHEESHTA